MIKKKILNAINKNVLSIKVITIITIITSIIKMIMIMPDDT